MSKKNNKNKKLTELNMISIELDGTQESLDFKFSLGHAAALKLLGRACRPFGSHNARGISLHSCAWRIPGLHPKIELDGVYILNQSKRAVFISPHLCLKTDSIRKTVLDGQETLFFPLLNE